MQLYHATHLSRLDSILLSGLLIRRCRTRRKWIWLCDAKRIAWAMSHVANSHCWRYERMAVVRVNASRLRVGEYRQGIYYSTDDIPAERIGLCPVGR